MKGNCNQVISISLIFPPMEEIVGASRTTKELVSSIIYLLLRVSWKRKGNKGPVWFLFLKTILESSF